MQALLSGMPECKIGINDKLIMEKDDKAPKRNSTSVSLDDCTFHRCVRLGRFDADRTITFIPPDGEFELMRYRISENVDLPFKIFPTITEEGKTRISVHIKITANFNQRLFATDVTVKIPTPSNTTRFKLESAGGRATYEPLQKAIVWRIRKFAGGSEQVISGHVELIKSTKDKAWVRPPLSMEFSIPMFTSSGLHIRFLKVFEKSSYHSTKWVRYITKAGQYEVRI